MYTVVRKDQKIMIVDHAGRPVFTSPEDGLIVHRGNVLGTEQLVVSKVKELKDEDLLLAVATAVKIG